jgi:hypothetical protein
LDGVETDDFVFLFNDILPDASIGVSQYLVKGSAASGGVLNPKRE